MARLILQRKAEILAEYNLNEKASITIGSAKGNAVVLGDKNVSEHHCTVTRKKGVYEIKDNNTLTGTRVNDRTVTEKELQNGDAIGIGPFTLTFLSGTNKANPEEKREKFYCLLGIYGKFEGKKYLVRQGETNIGREKISPKGVANDITLTGDMTASKGHAKIVCQDDKKSIMDIGSTGGVAVNGDKVGQMNEVPLKEGDEIAIGRTIFRFVAEGNEDYALPRHHKIFLLKIRKPFLTGITGLLIAVALVLLFRGLTGISTINGKPKNLNVTLDENWSPQNNMVRTAPGDYDISSTPAIGDMNGDGVNDIVFLNSSGLLYAWDGKRGAELWSPVELFNSGKSSVALADMNSDGVPDIIAVSDASMLYVVDGQSGNIIRKEVLGGTISELSPAVGDLDGDGKPDVVVCSEEGMVHFIYAPGYDQRVEKFTEFVDAPIYASPIIVSTKKISPMAVVCNYGSKVYFFDGKTRQKRTMPLDELTGKAHLVAAAPAAGDLNGDGIPEVVVQSNVPQYISAIDITKFDVLWTYFVEPVPPAGLKHHASPVIADMNGDKLGDIAVLSANGVLYVLKGKTGYPTGELLWKLDVPGGGKMVSSPSLNDFSKDGSLNVVFGTEDGSIIVARNIMRRKEMEVLATLKASNVPITSSIVMGDVDNDRKIEMVYSNSINSVQIAETNVKTFRGKVNWPMYLGTTTHDGNPRVQETKMPFIGMTAGSLFILLSMLLTRVLSDSKKLGKRPRKVSL
jgi:pSer/pThr/pTyr-binding forkhead associated (FHA) protein/outer membrane protein assembly factor BamB